MFAFRNLGVEPISSYRRIFSSNRNREFKWAYQGILNGVTEKMNACLGFELATSSLAKLAMCCFPAVKNLWLDNF